MEVLDIIHAEDGWDFLQVLRVQGTGGEINRQEGEGSQER